MTCGMGSASGSGGAYDEKLFEVEGVEISSRSFSAVESYYPSQLRVGEICILLKLNKSSVGDL